MILAALAMALADQPVKLVDGGICTGLAWVKVPEGAAVTMSQGPDYSVYYVDWAGKLAFGVYVGGYPMASPDTAKPLAVIEGLMIRPSHNGAEFQGYIVGNQDYMKNHFYGSAFKDNAEDAVFFRRALFGTAAAAKCKSAKGASQ